MATMVNVIAYDVTFYKSATHQCWSQTFLDLSEVREYLRLANHYDERPVNKQSMQWIWSNDVVIIDIGEPYVTQTVLDEPHMAYRWVP